MSTLIRVAVDLICPWCFIGKRKLELALKAAANPGSFTVEWLPFELDVAMPASGQERSSYRTRRFGSLEKSQQMDQRATVAGRDVGIDFRYDLMTRTPNTFDAHRLIWWAREFGGNQASVVEELFQAYFIEGKDIGARQTLLHVAERARLPLAQAAASLESDASAAEVRALEKSVLAQGVAGVPAYFLNQSRNAVELDSIIGTIR
jgi:predicted DsbA family dithiol-disulfide isomerase